MEGVTAAEPPPLGQAWPLGGRWAVLWAHASAPAVLWRPLSTPSAPSPSRHGGRWGPRSPHHKFQLLMPGPPRGPCPCTETAALTQGLPRKESLTSWRRWEVGWLAGLGGRFWELTRCRVPHDFAAALAVPGGGTRSPDKGDDFPPPQDEGPAGLRAELGRGAPGSQLPRCPACAAPAWWRRSAQGSELGSPPAPGARQACCRGQ